MNSQVITNMTAGMPYVSSGMADAAENMGAETVSSPSMLAADVKGQADIVDIQQARGEGQEGRENAGTDGQKRSRNGKVAGQAAERSVVITYNQLARESVVKYLDAEGHVISQSPPQMYLKTMESSSSKVDKQPGKLLNKVA